MRGSREICEYWKADACANKHCFQQRAELSSTSYGLYDITIATVYASLSRVRMRQRNGVYFSPRVAVAGRWQTYERAKQRGPKTAEKWRLLGGKIFEHTLQMFALALNIA